VWAGARLGATFSWRRTPPRLAGDEIAIRYALRDMGDWVLDSTVLIDNFTGDVGEGG
jgi:hypothetical protein